LSGCMSVIYRKQSACQSRDKCECQSMPTQITRCTSACSSDRLRTCRNRPFNSNVGSSPVTHQQAQRTFGYTILRPNTPSPQHSACKCSEKPSHFRLAPAVSTRRPCDFVGPLYDHGPSGLSGGVEGIRFRNSIFGTKRTPGDDRIRKL
jgi:hypothetical protein